MKKYLIIIKDFSLFYADELIDNDIINSEKGLITIVRLSDMKQHIKADVWESITLYNLNWPNVS